MQYHLNKNQTSFQAAKQLCSATDGQSYSRQFSKELKMNALSKHRELGRRTV
jgi:hypothetical protein